MIWGGHGGQLVASRHQLDGRLGSQMAAVFDSSPPGLAAGAAPSAAPAGAPGAREDTAAIKANIIQERRKQKQVFLFLENLALMGTGRHFFVFLVFFGHFEYQISCLQFT